MYISGHGRFGSGAFVLPHKVGAGTDGTDRDRRGQTGTDRDRQGQTGAGRDRQAPMVPCHSSRPYRVARNAFQT